MQALEGSRDIVAAGIIPDIVVVPGGLNAGLRPQAAAGAAIDNNVVFNNSLFAAAVDAAAVNGAVVGHRIVDNGRTGARHHGNTAAAGGGIVVDNDIIDNDGA